MEKLVSVQGHKQWRMITRMGELSVYPSLGSVGKGHIKYTRVQNLLTAYTLTWRKTKPGESSWVGWLGSTFEPFNSTSTGQNTRGPLKHASMLVTGRKLI